MSQLSATWAQIGRHAGAPIIAVNFGGVYPPGSAGNEFAEAMAQFLRTVLAQTGAAAVILDVTRLEYVFGDGIGNLAIALVEEGTTTFRPAAVVATGNTAVALQPLLEPNFVMGLAGIRLVRTRQEGLRVVTAELQNRVAFRGNAEAVSTVPYPNVTDMQQPTSAASPLSGKSGFKDPGQLLLAALSIVVIVGITALLVLPLANIFQINIPASLTRAIRVIRWGAAIILAGVAGIIILANVFIVVATIAGERTPSYLPFFGTMFGVTALVVVPHRLAPAVIVAAFVLFLLSELAGSVPRR